MTAIAAPPLSKKLTRDEWSLVVLLAAINFTHILDFVIVMPLGDRLRHELEITPSQFGYIVSIYGLCATIAGILASMVVDRFDRKKVLLSTFGGFLLATVYCGLAPDYFQLILARGLAGLFGGLAASSILAVIGDVIPDQRRGQAIGVVTASFAVASIIGLPIGLSLASRYGRGAPFLAIAGLGACVWLWALSHLPALNRHKTGERPHPFTQFYAVIRQGNHQRSFLFMLMLVFGTFTVVPFLAPYMQANCGRSESDIPIVYSVAGFCTLVMMLFIGYLTDHLGQRPVFLITASLAIVMTVVLTNLPEVSLVGASLAASGFMMMAAGRVVPAQAMMLKSADPALRGAFTNLNSAVSHMATGVAPLISGAIIGEQYPGGPLTNYWVTGLVAICFGLTALGLSFTLRPAVSMNGPIAQPG